MFLLFHKYHIPFKKHATRRLIYCPVIFGPSYLGRTTDYFPFITVPIGCPHILPHFPDPVLGAVAPPLSPSLSPIVALQILNLWASDHSGLFQRSP
ncbi:hypothetical protein VUR80DRAFT_6279 [Thermomyces stellatus]